MSDFKELFEALQLSIVKDEFVKLTISKPHRKKEGLLNVYVRFYVIEGEEILEFKYRHVSENQYKNFSLKSAKVELEKLLL